MLVNYGGAVGCSTIDYPGKSAYVIFLRNCMAKCPTCHNKQLWAGNDPVLIDEILEDIEKASKFVSAVCISGGEPLLQGEAVEEIGYFSHELGLEVGIETSGLFGNRIADIYEDGYFDMLLLDVKTELDNQKYMSVMGITKEATGLFNPAKMVENTLDLCGRRKIPMQIRTTIFPSYPSQLELEHIAVDLMHYIKIPTTWKLQQGTIPEIEPVDVNTFVKPLNKILKGSKIKITT